jgi:hypothetical protein
MSSRAVRSPWRSNIAAIGALAAPIVMVVVAAVALAGDVIVAVLVVVLVALLLLLAVFGGRFPGLLSWSPPEFEVRSSGPVEVGLDGEALMLDPPLRFTSLPGALRVRLPSGVGLPPAARAAALTADNPGALLRVVAGR